MIYYLIQAIDVINYSKVEILKQCKTENDAKKSLKQIALNLIKENGGDRQVQIATDRMMNSLRSIKKGNLNVYPVGYYIQEKKYDIEGEGEKETNLFNTTIEIYEKYEVPGYVYSSYKIHLVKVITIVPIKIDNNLELTCNVGSLYSSIYKPKIEKEAVPYMDELKEKLKKRNLKKKEQKRKLELKKKFNEEMQEILKESIVTLLDKIQTLEQ